jgi:hypothetical protein
LDSIDPNPAKKGLKYWCQDETRIGLKTIERKKITACGIKTAVESAETFVAPNKGRKNLVKAPSPRLGDEAGSQTLEISLFVSI